MLVVEPNAVPYNDPPTITRSTTATYINSSGSMVTAAINEVRFTYNPVTLDYEGMLLEPARTNRFTSSASLSGTVSVSGLVTGETYTLSFYGSGTVTYTGGSLVGVAGTFPANRVSKTVVATGTSMTFTASGTVSSAQIELGTWASSYIATSGSVVTRAADVVSSGTAGPGRVIYTNVTEAAATWSSATTYAINDYVMYKGRGYQSLQGSNTNKNPLTETTWWKDIGVGKVYSAFDTSSATLTSASSVISYVVEGDVNSVALLAISSDLYPVVVEIAARHTTNGYLYTKKVNLPTVKDSQAFLLGLANTCNLASFKIYSSAAGPATFYLGNAVLGNSTDIGATQYGATAGIIDYSRKETDAFGSTTFVERAFSKRLSAKVLVDNASLNTVQKLLYSIRAKPSIWVASEDPNFQDTLIVYGFYRDFSTDIAYPSHSICNLEIEGLV